MYSHNRNIIYCNLRRNNADNTTGPTFSSISSLLRLIVLGLAKVVFQRVDHDSTPDNAVGAIQGNLWISYGDRGVSIFVSHDVAKVTNVSHSISWSTMINLQKESCS